MVINQLIKIIKYILIYIKLIIPKYLIWKLKFDITI